MQSNTSIYKSSPKLIKGKFIERQGKRILLSLQDLVSQGKKKKEHNLGINVNGEKNAINYSWQNCARYMGL